MFTICTFNQMKKTAVIELLNSFEDKFDLRGFIQGLVFIEKVEKGLKDVADGKVKDLKEAKSKYNDEFVSMILQGDEDLKAGKGVKLNIDKLF
jgi:hypothetical protein